MVKYIYCPHDTIKEMKWGIQTLVICTMVLGLVFGAFMIPDVYAVSESAGLVPSGSAGYDPAGYGTCEFVEAVNNVMQFLIGISALIAVIVFMYAGYMMVYSSGNSGLIQQAKGVFANVLIGVMILLSAYLIVNTILSMLVSGPSGILSWERLECSYAYKVGDVIEYEVNLLDVPGVVVNRYVVSSGSGSNSVSGSSSGIGGSCNVPSSSSNACHPSNLGCFGSKASQASQVCSLESGGGKTNAVSGTDLCKDQTSFSGGLFQINVLAHYNNIPGCSNDFFTKNGSGTQGNCLRWAGPTGNKYCAIRDCRITKPQVYQACMNAIFDPSFNVSYACTLYNRRGNFGDWSYSAGKCGV